MTTRNDTGPQGYCGFEVGQHVVCMKASASPDEHHEKPIVGRVYTVRAVAIGLSEEGPVVGLLLKEIVNKPRLYKTLQGERVVEKQFPARNFRSLPKLRVEDFLAASTPKDVVGRMPA